jgi:hypothetical protein
MLRYFVCTKVKKERYPLEVKAQEAKNETKNILINFLIAIIVLFLF